MDDSARYAINASAMRVDINRIFPLPTLQLWNVDKCHCLRTIVTPSGFQDVVYSHPGNTVITGHFDQKLRFWDERSDRMSNEIALSGKITGMDLSAGKHHSTPLLFHSRNDGLLCESMPHSVTTPLTPSAARTTRRYHIHQRVGQFAIVRVFQ